jgi:predicted ester cyclase
MIAVGDRVATRFVAPGTQRGELMGIPPSGKPVTMTGMDLVRFANGKAVEHWGNGDDLGMMQQLGVIPPPPGH